MVVNAWKNDKPNGYDDYSPTLSKTYGNDEDFVMADDPARKILGGDWQVPTKTIWKALRTAIGTKISSSNGSEVIIDGIKGRKFTKTDGSNTYIFLPHAGSLQKKEYLYGDYFPYWTSTEIYCFDISGRSKSTYTCFTLTDRRWGMTIRAVRLVAE